MKLVTSANLFILYIRSLAHFQFSDSLYLLFQMYSVRFQLNADAVVYNWTYCTLYIVIVIGGNGDAYAIHELCAQNTRNSMRMRECERARANIQIFMVSQSDDYFFCCCNFNALSLLCLKYIDIVFSLLLLLLAFFRVTAIRSFHVSKMYCFMRLIGV